MNKSMSFIGAGSMAEGLVRGLIRSELCPAQNIRVFDVLPERMALFHERYGVSSTKTAQDAIRAADIVFITALPKHADLIMSQIREAGRSDQLVISLLAGITFARMEAVTGPDRHIARVMPNALIEAQNGYSALCFNDNAKAQDIADVERIFNAMGQTMILDESMLDPFTAFSCFQPEMIYYYLTALIDAGVQSGFSWQQAHDITVQTCIGTGQTLALTGLHPYVLSNTMSSPGGCGIEGLHVLYKSGAHGAVMDSVRAALRRIVEMGAE